jgi:SAM-dependent methyltransferase
VRLAKVDLDLGEDIPFEERSFRFITALEVIEHLESPGRLLDQIARLLAPDGVALLTTPNLESTAARIRFLAKGSAPYFDERSDPTHVFPVLRRCLDTMLLRRGLQVVESWGYPASGSVVFRKPIMWLARCLGFLPEVARGDNHCLLIARGKKA